MEKIDSEVWLRYDTGTSLLKMLYVKGDLIKSINFKLI